MALARFKDERGVAMVTVLFIGAALTVVTSAAAFTTIQEFRAGSDDRKAAEALSYAEAGIDRFLTHLKSGLITYNQLNRAGCQDVPLALPTGTVGNGTFTANIRVYDPNASGANRFPIPPSSGACASRPTSPHPGQGGDKTWFIITSTGSHPDATRVVRQIVALEPIGLPVGIYGHAFAPSAQPGYKTVSIVSETTYTDRLKTAMQGTDPYYKIGDFFSAVTGASLTDAVPAGVHAVGGILLQKSRDPEFTGGVTGTKNCSANSGPSPSQSLWDSDGSTGSGDITSGCSGAPGLYPNSSKFTQANLEKFAKPRLTAEDHQVLKEAAQRYGVYCTLKGTGGTGSDSCIAAGNPGSSDYHGHISTVLASRRTFVVYIEFRAGAPTARPGNEILNLPNIGPCSTDPAVHQSVVVIVKNGGVNWGGGAGGYFNGALIADGNYEGQGNFEFTGTMIIHGTISAGSASATYQMTPCWVQNMPGPFFRTVPGHWSEVDR